MVDAPSIREGWGVVVVGFPAQIGGGPVGIPNEFLVAGGIGLVAFLALMAGTSAARERAPEGDPLVKAVDPVTGRGESGGVWPRRSRREGAFEDGRELARHARASSRGEVAAHVRALGLGMPRVDVDSPTATRVHVPECRSCRERAWWRGRRGDCAFERGLLTGAFEAFVGPHVTVRETACGGRKRPCAFRVEHAPDPEA